MRILIITGLSGSGKSTAVRALEDEGFFCLDNLPVSLFSTFIELVGKSEDKVRDVALVMDIRGRDFLKGYEKVFQEIREAGHVVEILFFDATDEVLIRRFSETRRRHPALDNGLVPEGIRFEREQLAGLRRLATTVIDTSELNVHQLKELVIIHVKGDQGAREMTVHLQSFAYRYGIPLESDLVLDVRFLPNPHFVPGLKQFSGLDPAVRDFVLSKTETGRFLDKLRDLLEFLVAGYRREGKTYLTVSIGCTGGRHRSVVITEELRNFFEKKNIRLKLTHRDMEKG
jgi:RNase adapter protein RapZ